MIPYEQLSPVVREQLEEIAKTTGLSPEQIIDNALINLFGNEGNFVVCPQCGDHLAIKDMLTGEPPVETFTCGCCGTSISYDTEREEMLDPANTAK
jgi:hypothetical protein